MQICAGCDRPILDRFLLNVLDRAWHIRCVQCADCQSPLTDKCFSRDGKLYCREDFFIRYGTKCAGCLLGISPSDLVRRARSKVFHLKCFTCMVCRKELSTGEELYILDENKFICKEDYLASKLSGSDVEDDVDFDSVLDKQESEQDYNMESDNTDSKHDLFLQASDASGPHTLNGFANQLHHNVNLNINVSPGGTIPKTDPGLLSSLPSSPIVQPSDKPLKEEPVDQLSDSCASPPPQSPGSQTVVTNPASNCSSIENNDTNNNKDAGSGEKTPAGNKRRGPRTTIKAKQLEVLKASFNATPKPTRHIREQLAAETGLNMRVIQVWFQNRRSKERRMKQLSALGARRHFFARSPRRMRALRAGMSPSEIEESELMSQGYGYFNDNGQEFYPTYPGPGFGEFFPGQAPDMPPGMPLLPPQGRRTPPMGMDHQALFHGHMGPEPDYMGQPDMLPPPSSSPEPLMHSEEQYLMQQQLPPRSLPAQFQTSPPDNWG